MPARKNCIAPPENDGDGALLNRSHYGCFHVPWKETGGIFLLPTKKSIRRAKTLCCAWKCRRWFFCPVCNLVSVP